VSIPSERLLEIVIEGLKNNKAKNIHILNLKKLENAVSEYFVVCHGTSKTHVSATAQSVENEVKTILGEYPWKKEGYTNGEWALVDFSSIVVHVFQKEVRNFYNIEELWADAEITILEDE